jgi:hypothetical protein
MVFSSLAAPCNGVKRKERSGGRAKVGSRGRIGKAFPPQGRSDAYKGKGVRRQDAGKGGKVLGPIFGPVGAFNCMPERASEGFSPAK